jgi:hypothetical protein
LKQAKEAIEYIDTICEWPPAEFDTWPFETPEERMRENNKIAEIATMQARWSIEEEVNPILDALVAHQKMLERATKILKMVNKELEQIQGHLTNLDKRVYPLEEQSPRKRKSKY